MVLVMVEDVCVYVVVMKMVEKVKDVCLLCALDEDGGGEGCIF